MSKERKKKVDHPASWNESKVSELGFKLSITMFDVLNLYLRRGSRPCSFDRIEDPLMVIETV